MKWSGESEKEYRYNIMEALEIMERAACPEKGE